MKTNAREEKQKDRILEATVRAIALSGLDNVTMQSIATTAGLSKGGLTHYFSTKHELFLAAFTHFFEKVVDECKANSNKYDTPIEKLLSFDMIFNTDQQLFNVAHPVLHSFMAVAVYDETYSAIYHEWVENWVDIIRDILKEGLADQSIFCSDIDITARTLSAIIQGIATRVFLAPNTHSQSWANDSYANMVLTLIGNSPR
jgi:AcrR family transcriptional regulator